MVELVKKSNWSNCPNSPKFNPRVSPKSGKEKKRKKTGKREKRLNLLL